AELARARDIETDNDLEPLVANPPAGADPAALNRLRHMYDAGGWVLVESGVADLPGDLRWLYESDAVTLEQLATLHRALGVTSAADLAAAVQEQRIRAIDGLGAAIEQRIPDALRSRRAHIPRTPLGRATMVAAPVLELLRATPGVAWAEPTGSLRRGQDLVGDIELVAAAIDPGPVIEAVMRVPQVSHTLHRTARRMYLLIERSQVGVRIPEPAAAAAVQLYLTGSAPPFPPL